MAKKTNYEHFISDVDEKPDFMKGIKCHLVKSLSELNRLLNRETKYMAWDTEASSLSPEEGTIVGFSFGFDPVEGWYVPIEHLVNNIKDDYECEYEREEFIHDVGEIKSEYSEVGLKALYLLHQKCKGVMNFLFNVRYDFRMMEYAGFDMSQIKYYDVAVGCFLSDTNVKLPSLKGMERKFLGWLPDTFSKALGEKSNYKFVDPEEGYIYPCVDAVGTFAVCGKTIKFYQEA